MDYVDYISVLYSLYELVLYLYIIVQGKYIFIKDSLLFKNVTVFVIYISSVRNIFIVRNIFEPNHLLYDYTESNINSMVY